MREAVLDTDILSYIVDRRYPDVVATASQYARAFGYFSVSVVTIAETVEGLESQGNFEGSAAFLKLAEDFEVIPIETEEAVLAGKIFAALNRAGQRIGELDPYIAATAIQIKRRLVTNNTKHYQRIVDLGFPLELDNWRKA
ncbi:MAG: PIN domain-containing protein [Fimbriimonadaceae bacterium]